MGDRRISTDGDRLSEVLGSAIALNLLLGIP